MIIRKGINHFRFYLSFLLLGFYLAVGIVFLFTEIWADLVPKGRYLIGLFLIVFGIVRFYVAFRRYRNKHTHLKIKAEENVKQK